MNLKRIMAHPLVSQWGGMTLSLAVWRWMSTLDFKTAYYDPCVDPTLNDLSRQRYIYLFWHEYIPYQLYLRGNCNICMMLSQNKDGNFLDAAGRRLGFLSVRGSTYTNPIHAVRGMMRSGRNGHLTMTPDGPRGPRRVLSMGAIYLASRLNAPLVLLGMGYDRPWRLASWDQFAVPRPFSRARCVMSPPVAIPRVPKDKMEPYRLRVQELLNQLTEQAEAWAASGQRLDAEWPTGRFGRAFSLERQPILPCNHVPYHRQQVLSAAARYQRDPYEQRLHVSGPAEGLRTRRRSNWSQARHKTMRRAG